MPELHEVQINDESGLAARDVAIAPTLERALRTTLLHVLAKQLQLRAVDGPSTLHVGPRAGWYRMPDGMQHDMAGRASLHRILQRLLEAHEAGGERLGSDALLAAGWPGERMTRQAGLNRLYVAMASLRKLGLRAVLQRDALGYRLDPELIVLRAR